MSQSKVTDMLLYPIKGCRGYSVEQVVVTPMGLLGDREFALVKDGERANQKQLPDLIHLTAVWKSPDCLVMKYPSCEDFELDCSLQQELAIGQIQVYGKDVPTLDMGNAVAEWLSKAFNADVRLAKTNGPFDWFLPLPEFSLVHGEPQTKFVDAAPLLLTNAVSLTDLNSRLEEDLPMNRFRPNIVVDGLEPYYEDELASFNFPNVSLARVTVCERCIVTTTNQETGERKKEPLRALSKYRKRENDYAGGILFGIYLTATSSGELAIGDNLE
ncbi:MAG: hypothetical protein ACJAVI_005978 [Candidatus Azotimanducaceae bacterium]|jgi:uncharacterized protein YcbX